jgi:hypothetical protein
MHQY